MRRASLTMGLAAVLLAAATSLAAGQEAAPAGQAAALSAASVRLGFDLLGASAGKSRGEANPTVSPAGLGTALALLDLGAEPLFHAALRKVLHLDGSGENGVAALRQALAPLIAGREAGPLSGVSAVYFDPKSQVRAEALDALRKTGATVEVEDLSSAAAIEAINALVRKRTKGLVPGILDRPLAKGGLVGGLVVLDALHFKDDWESAFDPAHTAEADFHLAGGRTVRVALMHGREETLPIRREGRFVAVALPYRTPAYSLVLVTTTDGPAGLADFAPVAGWLSGDGFAERRATVALPRFAIKAGGDVLAALDQLGLKPARLVPTALSGFSAEPLAIDRIVQKVVILVDEKGTEAAAATAVTVTRAIPGPPPIAITLDRPFLFALHDARSGQALIEGYVGDPSKAK